MKPIIKSLFPSLLFFMAACHSPQERQATVFAKHTTANAASVVHYGPPNILDSEFRNGKLNNQRQQADLQIAEYVRRIFQDRQGNLWFGTNSYGVCRYDGISFKYFSVDHGLGGNQITTIMEDRDGNLWFSTNGGVTRFDPSKEQSGSRAFTTYTTKHGLSDNWVWSLFQDREGVIWAGTNAGLCRFTETKFVPFTAPQADTKKGSCSPPFSSFALPQAEVKNPQARFSTQLVRSIMQDNDGNHWFGTDGVGVCIYNGTSFRHLTTEDGLCGNQIVSMIQDKSGNIWLSSMFGGLSRYDGQSFTNYTVENNSIGDNEVWTIYEDRSGDIWFCSEGFGVYRIHADSITNFSTKEGLPIKAVQSIFEDKEGHFWIGGYGGLYRYDGQSFVNITRADGC